MCVDFRRLNTVTPQQQSYIPCLDDILERLGQSRVLSKVDLSKGFHQVLMSEKSKDLTTFVCPFGKYCFRRMPFGLKNAPAVFQLLMEKVLVSCKDFSAVYIDDIIIFSSCWDEHIEHVRKVLSALKVTGLTAKSSKCQWGKRHLDYLGHRVGCGKAAVPEHRVVTMAEYRKPVRRKDLRSFLGSIGYYRHFIPNFAKFSSLLTTATSVKAPGTVRWTPEMLDAFHSLRKSLCGFCVLTVPSVHDVFELHTDASGQGIGSVLNVIRQNSVLPVAFHSRQLRGAERRYSVTELEALAVCEAIKHFSHFLYSASFTVLTDHKPLTSLLISKNLNHRLQSMALKLMLHSVTILYRKSVKNSNVDGLSRHAWVPEEEVTVVDPIKLDPPTSDLSRGHCGASHGKNEDVHGLDPST